MIRLDISVSEIVSRNPAVCRPDATVKDAVHLMAENNTVILPVCDETGLIVGLITEIDLVRAGSRYKKVSEVMNKDFQVVTEHSSLGEVMRIIATTSQHAVPVVTPGRRLEGLVGAADIMKLCAKEFS
jgi:CBS domain-containing protein